MKYTILTLLAITFIATTLFLSSKLDTKRNDATQKYEECVQREYAMSPMEFYYNNNKMPYCHE